MIDHYYRPYIDLIGEAKPIDFMLSAIVWTKLSIYVVPVIFKLLLYACICCALFKAWLETLALCFIVSDGVPVGIITFNIGKTYIFCHVNSRLLICSLLSLRDSNKLFLPYVILGFFMDLHPL
ncbi:hypothetical protein ACJX0J_023641, partial [Zea mays]